MSSPDLLSLVRKYKMASALALSLAVPLPAGAGIPFLGGTDIIIAPGTRFIDGLGTSITLPTATDMSLRFRDGPRYDPRDLFVLDDPRINLYAREAESYINELLAAYKRGPKPTHMSVYIVESDDPNCMVVPVNDGQESKAAHSGGLLDMLKQAPDTLVSKTAAPARPAAVPKTTAKLEDFSPAKGGPPPEQLEVRCTTAFFLHLKARDDANDEVRFILAHELSHILLGHWERQEKMQRQSEEIATLVADGMLLSTVVNSKYSHIGNQINITPTPQVSKDISKLFVADLAMQEFTNVVLGPHWQLAQERQADLLALDLLQEAGESRAGATSLLSGERAMEEERKKNEPPFAQTFLTSTAALAFVDLNQTGTHNVKGQLGTQTVYMLYKHWHESGVTHVHDNADKRLVTIGKYEADHKPPALTQTSKGKAFFSQFAQDFAPIQAAEDLEKDMALHGCDGLSDASAKTIESLKHSKSRTQKENSDLANIYICKAQWSDALVPARAAALGKDRNPYFYLQYITVLQSLKGHQEDALKIIDEAEEKAPPPGQYVIPEIQTLLSLKRQSQAEKAAADCRDHQASDIGRRCMALIGQNLDGTPLPPEDPEQKVATAPAPVPEAGSVIAETLSGGRPH